MKAVSNYHPPYEWNLKPEEKEKRTLVGSYDFTEYGKLVHHIDESESYAEDETVLLKKGRYYTLLTATGCSCWDGDWEGWTDLTLTELRKLGSSWEKDWGSAGSMGKWINENLNKSSSRK